jgi:hypothetical protein
MLSKQKDPHTVYRYLSEEELLQQKRKIQHQKEELEKNPTNPILWKELAISLENIGTFLVLRRENVGHRFRLSVCCFVVV